ncbi:HlyD family type I secretion periplasmic adaptor subunit [Salmonella enterica]|nr:HlyD family type I secretion periplasmic adaptor subunit [Salmonella enterica]
MMQWLIVFLLILLGISSSVEINAVVHGEGNVVNRSNSQVVSLSKGGVIADLYCHEGDYVHKGQELAKIINHDIDKDFEQKKVKAKQLQKKINDLSYFISNNLNVIDYFNYANVEDPEIISNSKTINDQIQSKQSESKGAESEIHGLEEEVKNKKEEYNLSAKEINIIEPLVKKGISPLSNLLVKKQSAVRLQSEISEINNQIVSKNNFIDLKGNEISTIRQDYLHSIQKKLQDSENDLSILNAELKIIGLQRSENIVHSPVEGVIYNVNKNAMTIGGVISSTEMLFEIKPVDKHIRAEVKINPKYRDQIFVGEKTTISIESIVNSRRQPYPAIIESISPDIIESKDNAGLKEYYKVMVEFYVSDSALSNIKPGMIVDANIITGKHTILDYLMSPIAKTFKGALSEPLPSDHR